MSLCVSSFVPCLTLLSLPANHLLNLCVNVPLCSSTLAFPECADCIDSGVGDDEVCITGDGCRLVGGVPAGVVCFGVLAGLPLEGVGTLDPGLLPDAEIN